MIIEDELFWKKLCDNCSISLSNILDLSKLDKLSSYTLIIMTNKLNSLLKIVNSFNYNYNNKITKLIS